MLRQLLRTLRGNPASRLNDKAIALWRRGELAAAERAFRAAIAANPAFAPAYSNLGMVVWDQRRLDEGLALLRHAVELDPGHFGARINLANALVIGDRIAEGIRQYQDALALCPDHPDAQANMLKALLDVGDWDAAERLVAQLVARWREAPSAPEVLDAMNPFASLLVDVPQAMRLDVARRHSQRITAWTASLSRPRGARRRDRKRLRIGYASANFHDHAVGHLTAGVYELHDRDRFEICAYSFGIDDASDHRRRLVAAFDSFDEVRAASFEEIARRIAADGIDILVDLMGHTGESRTEIFALRPAPIQVNWLGYPGTMGAGFIDYIVADLVIVPESEAQGYSERMAWLPGSYQSNDDCQAIAQRTMTRAEFGLPEPGFVYCAFHKHCKIERAIFDAWLRVLAAVPGSVLWLMSGHAEGILSARAARAGVDPARIVFAGKLPKAEHLARHRLADLYLDTHTYNGHTTASDALWAGLPVLTWPGEGFAGRVAASLASAVGLPELVVSGLAEYERVAVDLTANGGRLRGLREQLAGNRLRMPLFRTADFVSNLEAAYQTMWERHRAGLPPVSFKVAPQPSRPERP